MAPSVSWRGDPPPVGTIHTSWAPLSFAITAIRSPPGDHAGARTPPSPFVSRTASGSPTGARNRSPSRRNAIWRLSPDQAGAAPTSQKRGTGGDSWRSTA